MLFLYPRKDMRLLRFDALFNPGSFGAFKTMLWQNELKLYDFFAKVDNQAQISYLQKKSNKEVVISNIRHY